MKKSLLFLLLALLFCPVFGQTRLSEAEQRQIVERVDQTASAMKTMQCEFVQTKRMKLLNKEMLSEGKMYFKSNDKLRWQYTKPYDYTFIMNGGKVGIRSSKSSTDIDVQGNKMFRQITSVILNCITGGCLKGSADFDVEMYGGAGQHYFARLYPKKKELKQIYRLIEIHFNDEMTMVSAVQMEEKTGDTTHVTLTNVKTNQSIDEKMFVID